MILTGDCVPLMGDMDEGSVDLVVADPPFNVGYGYDGYDDARPRAEYLAWAEEWMRAAIRVLRPGGAMWVAMGDEYAAEHKVMLDLLGMEWRNWVVWHYSFGNNCQAKFSRCHSHLLYYAKPGGVRTFDADAVRVPSARQAVYGDARADGRGKVPEDVWTFPRVCGTFKERTAHPCQWPVAIPLRIVAACTAPGGLVLDPFLGSGTTGDACRRLGRDWVGIELSPAYAEIAARRLGLEPAVGVARAVG